MNESIHLNDELCDIIICESTRNGKCITSAGGSSIEIKDYIEKQGYNTVIRRSAVISNGQMFLVLKVAK